MTEYERVVEALCARGLDARQHGYYFCPAHEDGQRPSLKVAEGADGRALVCCHGGGCSYQDVLGGLGLEVGRPADGLTIDDLAGWLRLAAGELRRCGLATARWKSVAAVRIPYLDEHGREVAARLRVALVGDKFRWPKDTKAKGLLYGAERLAEARNAGQVVLVEGETDVLTLAHHGIPAVGLPGAGLWDEASGPARLDGIERVFVVIEHQDDEPDDGGRRVLDWLGRSAIRDRAFLISLDGAKDPAELHQQDPKAFPELFRAALDAAQPWAERAERQRRQAAEKARDTADLLDEIRATIHRYLVIDAAVVVAIALWVLHTWTFGHALSYSTPYLHVTSAEKRSGKSRLLELLELVVREPINAANASDAAIFRTLDEQRATLLLDEVDTIFTPRSERRELIGILNAGIREGATVRRMVGEGTSMEPRAFKVFAPKVLCGIGELPVDTLRDRCLRITVERRRRSEHVARFRPKLLRSWATALGEALDLWAKAWSEQLADAQPELPDELDDRGQEGCEPLLAIAELAGGDWPRLARLAVIKLRGVEAESHGTRLLRDIRAIFDDRGDATIATSGLIDALCADELAPWAGWNKGQPITPRALARLLAPFGIASRQIGPSGARQRGYSRGSRPVAWCRRASDGTWFRPSRRS